MKLKTLLFLLLASISPAQIINSFDLDSEKTSTYIKVGSSPVVSWDVTYPLPIKDIITRDDTSIGDPEVKSTDTVIVKDNLLVSLRVLAADYVYSSTTTKTGTIIVYKPVWVQYKINGTIWIDAFKGIDTSLKGKTCSFSLKSGDKLELQFNGGKTNNPDKDGWNGWRDGFSRSSVKDKKSGKTVKLVMSLVNGDIPPSYASYFSPNSIGSYLAPYIQGGKIANLGTYDILYSAELTNIDPNLSGFDMQDIIVLVTLKK